mmetsp:Transcript_26577/g.61197  ORF Transcript_26577/g.61197 Transcript_26577/m.61197 type:complete len:194 (-) Transcript_26577:364-945(-)
MANPQWVTSISIAFAEYFNNRPISDFRSRKQTSSSRRRKRKAEERLEQVATKSYFRRSMLKSKPTNSLVHGESACHENSLHMSSAKEDENLPLSPIYCVSQFPRHSSQVFRESELKEFHRESDSPSSGTLVSETSLFPIGKSSNFSTISTTSSGSGISYLNTPLYSSNETNFLSNDENYGWFVEMDDEKILEF